MPLQFSHDSILCTISSHPVALTESAKDHVSCTLLSLSLLSVSISSSSSLLLLLLLVITFPHKYFDIHFFMQQDTERLKEMFPNEKDEKIHKALSDSYGDLNKAATILAGLGEGHNSFDSLCCINFQSCMQMSNYCTFIAF